MLLLLHIQEYHFKIIQKNSYNFTTMSNIIIIKQLK